MDINGRQAGAVVWNFDVVHARPLDVLGGIPEARDAAHIRVEAFLALRLQEALADVVIGAGAMQVLRAACSEPFVDALPSGVFHLARLARPFPKPSIVVAEAVLQAQADTIDLADLGAAPGRHVETDQQAVRPAIIFGKIGEGQLFELGIHATGSGYELNMPGYKSLRPPARAIRTRSTPATTAPSARGTRHKTNGPCR